MRVRISPDEIGGITMSRNEIKFYLFVMNITLIIAVLMIDNARIRMIKDIRNQAIERGYADWEESNGVVKFKWKDNDKSCAL